MGGGQTERVVERISWEELHQRLHVLLPLVRGWNPDCLIALNAEGLILAGLLNTIWPCEVRPVAVQEDPWQILWERIGEVAGKRVVVLGRHFDDRLRERVELFLKERQALSVVKMVIVGRESDYSCFPEKGAEVLLPWEEHAHR